MNPAYIYKFYMENKLILWYTVTIRVKAYFYRNVHNLVKIPTYNNLAFS